MYDEQPGEGMTTHANLSHDKVEQHIPWPTRRNAITLLVIVTVTYVLSFVDRQVLSLLVEPMRRDLGLTDMQLSLLQGMAFALIYCLAGLPLGRAADQFSRRNIIVVGVVIWCVMTGLCGIVSGFGLLFICRAGVGIGEAALSPSAYSMLTDTFPPRRLPLVMSIYNLGPSIGTGLAYLLGGVMLSIAGSQSSIKIGFLPDLRAWQATFIVIGGSGLLMAILMLLVREPARRIAAQEKHLEASFGETLRFLSRHRRSLSALIVGVALVSVVNYASITWYPTMFARSFSQDVARVGLVYGPIYVVSGIAGNLMGAWGAAKMAARQHRAPYVLWVLIAAVCLTIGSTIVPLLTELHVSYAATAVMLLFQNGWMGSAVAAAHLATPNRMRAQLTAITLFGTNIVGLACGPSLVAAVTEYVFRDPLALRYSLSILSAIFGALAIVVLGYCWRNFAAPGMDGLTAVRH